MPDRDSRELEIYLSSKIRRTDLLGNHYKKNLRNIRQFLPIFAERLHESGTAPLFDFERVSPFCYEEMELIRHIAGGDDEAFDLLGCYYSFNLISMNLNLLDTMEQGRGESSNRTALYKTMLLQAEDEFSRLHASLIQIFIEILSRDVENLPEFVICHVGARRDQDDLDVGIIHRPGEGLSALNRVIGRLNREMYRKATRMHFYLSEHSGSKWFSASIDEYERLMDVELKNFVIITQLFGAVPITGSISLFEEFQERVVRRYTYREGADNRYYEGFIRGVVEEIRSLVQLRTRTGEIVPKVDGLRLAKLIVSARRATLGILGGRFWKAFDTLKREDTLLRDEYAFLEKAIAFMESVRFLYQLIFVQEEGIFYTDPDCRAALDRVALLMGYRGTGREQPYRELLRDYFRYSRGIMEISGIFKEEFKKYVENIPGIREYKEGGEDRIKEQRICHGFLYHYRSPLLWKKINRLVAQGLIREEEAADTLQLHVASKRALKGIGSKQDFPARYQKLEDYYDIETIRFAFLSIRTGKFPRAGYMDSFLQRLVLLSLQEAGLTRAALDPSALGFYASGGNARREGFENDYDLFVLYDPCRIDPKPMNRAVRKVHHELARLGNMPHHRIAEQIGHFAVSIDELGAYLDRGNPDDFIERSELLGSRMVLGGSALHHDFVDRIIRKRIFRGKGRLIQALSREIRERHAAVEASSGLDLKQGEGGLFDITLLLCLLKACYEIYEPEDARTFRSLQKMDRSHAGDYRTLYRSRRFLTAVRGILKLTGYTEVVDETMDLRYPARIFGFTEPRHFVDQVSASMEKAAEISDRLIKDFS